MLIKDRSSRKGYSLVELLAVGGIIITVMAMIMAVYPSYSNRENLFRAADQIRNTLARARQWAIRDSAPTGVKFELMGSSQPGIKMSIVQGQAILTGNSTFKFIPLVGNANFTGTNVTIQSNIVNPDLKFKDPFGNPVYVSSKGRVLKVADAVPVGPNQATIIFTEPHGFFGSELMDFQVIRPEIILSGEPVIELFPNKATILLQIDNTLISPPTLPALPLPLNRALNQTIVFQPSGQVKGRSSGTIQFRVTQTEPTDQDDGDQRTPIGTQETDSSIISLDVISGTMRVR